MKNRKLSDLTIEELEAFLEKERNKKGRFQKDLEDTILYGYGFAVACGLIVGVFLIWGAYFR